MEDLIHSWLYALLMSGCICSLIQYINADGKIRTLLETGCACVMTLTFLSPITNLTMNDPFDFFFEKWTTIESQTEVSVFYDTYTKSIIEGKYAAYILTEAEHMGIPIQAADVQTKQDENGNLLPFSVTYTSNEPISNAFISHIANELGIPEERQITYENPSNH